MRPELGLPNDTSVEYIALNRYKAVYYLDFEVSKHSLIVAIKEW